MGRRRSGARVGAQSGLKLSFELFVFSTDPASCALACEARLRALRLSIVSSLDDLQECLDSHGLVCGMIVDADLDGIEREAMFKAVRDRWIDVPALALVRSSAPRSLASAHGIGDSWIFKSDDPARQGRRMGAFMRMSLDAQLWRTARLIQQGRSLGLSPTALETFTALMVLMLPRDVAGQRLGITEKGFEKRVTELCATWPADRFAGLSLSSGGSVVRDPPAELIRELEQQAEDALEEERTQRLGG